MKNLFGILLCLIHFTITAQVNNQSYFQQNVNYNIAVELKDSLNQITASELIDYTNNSESILDTIYFHIWPNAYKNLDTEFGKEKINEKDKDYVLNQEKYSGGIESITFLINEKIIEHHYHPKHPDILFLLLPKGLSPQTSIEIKCNFIVNIPLSHSRLGYLENAYQITQWYPKPAVYDKHGWHAFPYRDLGEFYSEFGKFKVQIKTPKAYTIAATGNLINKITESKYNTYIYEEDSIHDFAWVADKNLIIDIDSVQLPYSNRWVKTESYYHPESHVWEKSNQYVKDAIYYYSLWLGDYPYKTCKVVESELGVGGGMEYPTLSIIEGGPSTNTLDLETIIMHEVGHNWFYSVLASNERNHPFLDEGLNSAFESRYLETKYPNRIINDIEKFRLPIYKEDYYAYLTSASRNADQAGNLSSEQYTMMNYGSIVYKKNALLFNYLRHYWGDEVFDKKMKTYYTTWKYKHPQPTDLEAIFRNDTSIKSDWFFELLESRKKMDYKICSIKSKDQGYYIKIKNTKKIQSPLFLQSYQNDSLIDELKSDGFPASKTFFLRGECDKVYIDKQFRSLDYNRNNNFIKTKGLLKKTDGVSLEFFGSQVKENKTQIFYSPIAAYNTTNGFMLGVTFSSNLAFPPQFEYLIMPLYAFKNKQISGESRFEYHIQTNNNHIQEINPYLSSKTYGLNEHKNYNQFQSGIQIKFKNFQKSELIDHELKLYYLIASQYNKSDAYAHFINLEYLIKDQRWFNPYAILFKVNGHKDFALASLDLEQTLTYSKPFTGLKLRLFTGVFLFNQSNNGLYNLSLDGTYGIKDFDYQSTLVGRNETYDNFWAHQFIKNEGGFSLYAPFSSNLWMSSLTISSTLPIKSPFEAYFSLAAFENSNKYFEKGIAWEFGISFMLVRDFAIIYFPITAHKQILETNSLVCETYFEKIRFTLLLNQWNLKKLSRDFEKLIH